MKRIKVHSSTKLLVIDEVEYLPLDSIGSSLFFQLISARYERGEHHAYEQQGIWGMGRAAGDPVLATAVLDRLLHHTHIINIRENSYRLKDRAKTGLYKNPQENA
ncbi:ATP-binding protein [Acetomicrobium sp.]|jgi:DNA replication protein DnaC|uniref:ATP-binding protein n=1 Tax=Acetomicrobium sp. TaxID=1872099 RepID=UPI002FC92B25